MDFNKNDIEYYLLTKEYNSLTKQELAFVSDAVASEAEYNSLRQLLLVMEESPTEELIQPNPQIKDDLVTAFEKARWQRGAATDSTAKLVPIKEENKNNKNGLFWLSIAASLALLVGLYMSKDSFFNSADKQMAELKQEVVKESEASKLEEIKKEKAETPIEDSEELEAFEVENNTKEPPQASPNKLQEKEVMTNKDNKKGAGQTPITEDLDLLLEEEDIIEETVIVGSANSKSDDYAFDQESRDEPSITFSSAELELDDEVMEAELASVTLDDEVSKDKNSKLTTSVKESISLKGDKELIGLLYTAL
jgi:hypothetical protein